MERVRVFDPASQKEPRGKLERFGAGTTLGIERLFQCTWISRGDSFFKTKRPCYSVGEKKKKSEILPQSSESKKLF